MQSPQSSMVTAPDSRSGLTTRQMRAVVLIVAVALIGGFIALRSDRGAVVGDTDPSVDTMSGAELEVIEDVDAPVRERATRAYVIGDTVFATVEEGLGAADAALEAGRIYQPQGDNALEFYLGALAVAPDNEAAAEGLAAVGTLVRDAFWRSLVSHELTEAESLLPLLEEAGNDGGQIEEFASTLERLQRADDFVAAARDDIDSGRLVQPRGGSALARLERARELNAEHPELEAEFDRLESALVDQALGSARERRFQAAFGVLDRALEVRPNSRRLLGARADVLAFRDAQIGQRAESARAAMLDGDFQLVERLLDEIRRLGADRELLESLREENRDATIYGRFEPGEIFRDRLSGGREGPIMVVVPHGSFLMGSASDEAGHTREEEPQHRVYFRRGFALAQGEVSVAEFEKFVTATGFQTDADVRGDSFIYNVRNGRIIRRSGVTWRDGYTGREAQPNDPVLHVSFNDAAAYARWLASVSGEPYRLPSEAEFEYALRAGGTMVYPWGEESPEFAIENLTGSRDRSDYQRRQWNRAFRDYDDGYWGPAPVDSLVPNAFGIHHLAGNVEEWVEDCWHDSYVRAPIDGTAWVNRGCPRRVVRGGWWGGAPETARSAARKSYPTEQRGSSIGFRVARDLY
ncbi:MAG: SUMF1/EgtB/PvdO family nonheme iron enzyme [Pseudomonadota bacterium]